MSSLYQTIQPLSDEQRIEARSRAGKLVLKAVGDRPRREQFINATIGKYPLWFTRFVAGLMAVVFIAAGMPSLFRLYSAGRDYFMHGINDTLQASIVGFSTFMLAESLVILSTIAARVYFTGKARYIFVVPVIMGLMMALVGNWTVVQPKDLFSWLETLIPPFTVLFVALIGERLILESLETRHSNEKAYQEAVVGWQIASHAPEDHPRYGSALANVLREALRLANSEGTGATRRKELMSALSTEHWKALVYRELQADNWYATPLTDVPELPALPEPTKKRKEEAASVEVVNPFGPNPPTQDGHEFTPVIAMAIESVSSDNGNGKH